MYGNVPRKSRRRYAIGAMKQLRLPNESLWDEIGSLAFPFRLRLNQTDQNNSSRKNTSIFNSTATKALRVLQSGLMTAATDPTSQWLSLTLDDAERAEYGPHREWLDFVGNLILQDLGDSNTYLNLPPGYGNSACFGMSALGVEESYGRSLINTRLYNTGRYWIEQDDYGTTNQFYEECRSTVRQIYIKNERDWGGRATFSPFLRRMADDGKWDDWIDLAHLIEPNEDFKPGNPLVAHKRYSDCWWELGTSSTSKSYNAGLDREDYLYESGHDLFPVLCGKWSSIEGDVYPVEFPGSECLGDNKSLQIGEKRLWQLVERGVHPHWLVPTGLQGAIDENFTPGKSSYVDEREAGKSVRPSHVIDPGWITPMREQIQDVQGRILEAYHYPTFSMFDALPDKTQRTATEVVERKAEKLLKLVDMYTNLQIGQLRPIIDWEFYLHQKRGMLPPAPPDLQGHDIKYRFNGVLAQAQKMNRAQPIQAMLNLISAVGVAQQQSGQAANVFDKFNADQAIDEVGTDWGVPATVIRSDEEVAQIRQQRQAAAAQQQQMQALEMASKTAKNLAQSPLDEQNALSAIVGKT